MLNVFFKLTTLSMHRKYNSMRKVGNYC